MIIIAIVFLCGWFLRLVLDQYADRLDAVREEAKGSVTVYDDGTRVGRPLDYAENVSEDNPLLQAFQQENEDAEVILACTEDLTNDGEKDLVVIYTTVVDDEHVSEQNRGKHRHTRMKIVMGSADGDYTYTEARPAPVEQQKIQFKDIDNRDEIEFVLQGCKGNKVGYGIFRVENAELINLFGEGMEEC